MIFLLSCKSPEEKCKEDFLLFFEKVAQKISTFNINKMTQYLKNIENRFLNLTLASSLGQAKQKNTENEIGFYVPVLVKIIEFLILFLFLPVILMLLWKLLEYLIMSTDSNFLKENVDPNMFANILLGGISTFIISTAIYANTLFNKVPSKMTIIKHQKYIYLESSLGTLITVPINNVKSTLENSRVKIEFEKDIEVWLDLNLEDDKNFNTELLKYLSLSDASNS